MSDEIAGKTNFKGDLRSHAFGVAGPSTDGRTFEAVLTEYDEATDTTTVHYKEL